MLKIEGMTDRQTLLNLLKVYGIVEDIEINGKRALVRLANRMIANRALKELKDQTVFAVQMAKPDDIM